LTIYSSENRVFFMAPSFPLEPSSQSLSWYGNRPAGHKFRDECLNEHWFVTMAQARRIIETWRAEYNTERPHSSLGDLTPEEYADRGIAQPREALSLTADSGSEPDQIGCQVGRTSGGVVMKELVRSILPATHWTYLSWMRDRVGLWATLKSYGSWLAGSDVTTSVAVGEGARVFVRPGSADQTVVDEVFGSDEYAIDLTDPRLIVDAGAHIGLATVYFARRFPGARIVALEPEASNFEMLLRNVAAYPNVVAVKCGLWSHSARLEIVNPLAQTWSFRVAETSGAGACSAIGVSELLDEYGDGHPIDLLKIDIEGSEIEVLGSSKRWIERVRCLVIELHDRFRPGCSAALDRAIEGEGFVRTLSGESVMLIRTGLPGAHADGRETSVSQPPGASV
jgi:FkbM family methyltransferase